MERLDADQAAHAINQVAAEHDCKCAHSRYDLALSNAGNKYAYGNAGRPHEEECQETGIGFFQGHRPIEGQYQRAGRQYDKRRRKHGEDGKELAQHDPPHLYRGREQKLVCFLSLLLPQCAHGNDRYHDQQHNGRIAQHIPELRHAALKVEGSEEYPCNQQQERHIQVPHHGAVE